jgi:hypothetical protein
MNMQWHEFIFSEQRNHKLLRHFAFWVSWWLFFLSCFMLFHNEKGNMVNPFNLTPGEHLLLKTFLLMLLYALACYPLIYFILPEIIKRKWLKATVSFILLCSFLHVATYFLFWNVFSFIDSSSGSSKTNYSIARFWPALNLGLMNFAKVAAAAAIIKYLKYWWVKQKEKEKLEREKMSVELQLLKAQIRPGFLFNALDNIREHSTNSSPHAPESLLKLSELLSYMLYECDKPLVQLNKEIMMMTKYMELEKIRLGKAFEMGINIRGEVNDKMIAPFLLLPFIENGFKQSSVLNGNAWIIMDIGMKGNSFFMKLANGITQETNDSAARVTKGLSNAQKRLTLLYPQHELKIYAEQEMLITHLKIQLIEATQTVQEENEELVVTEPN